MRCVCVCVRALCVVFDHIYWRCKRIKFVVVTSMSCLAAAAYFSSLSTSFSLLLFLRLLFLLPTSLGLFDVILYESTARKCEHFLFIRHCHNPFSLSLSAVLFAFCACASLTFMSVKNTSARCCGRRFLLSLCLVAVECKHESEQRTQGYSAEIESSARARVSLGYWHREQEGGGKAPCSSAF